MNRTARASIIVVSVLILAYPVLAWLSGLRIQHVLEDRENQGLAQIPGYSQYITLVKRDYRRGVYSSSEDLTFRLGEKALKALGATGNVDLTIHNTIHHGPFPLARDFAPATVDTQWVVPAALHDKLVIHTRMNWTGGSTTLVNSPAFNLPLDKGATLDWRGLEAHMIAGRDIGSGTVTLTSPGLTFKSPDGTIAGYQDLKLDSTLHAAYEVLNVGDAKLTLGQLQVEEPNKPLQLLAHNLAFESHSKLNGEFMDVEGGLTIEAVKVNAFDSSHINYA